MPAVLTHKTIMLLARERLANIRDTLKLRLDKAKAPVTDLEHRLLFLATQAHALMSDNTVSQPAIDFPKSEAFASPLGLGVSKFAVMGSMGPDITGFSALFAPGQSWVFDTIHKGNPDGSREPIVAKTSDFVLEFWRQASSLIDSGSNSDAHRRALRAYALGHLCHIAADVVSHPFINDIEWHSGNTTRPKFSHSGGEGAIDAKVARQVLLRESTREGQNWQVWWPTFDEVPGAFFSAYTEAMEKVYRAQSARPTGFGEFEDLFEKRKAPSFDASFVEDGYKAYRHGILPMGYDWGYGKWWLFLAPAMLPLLALFPLTMAMPKAKILLEKSLFQIDDEQVWFQLLTLPLALLTPTTLFYGIWISGITRKGVEGLVGAGLGMHALSFVTAVAFFGTINVEGSAWWVRWFLLFGLPAGVGLVFTLKALPDFCREPKALRAKFRGAYELILAVPFLVMLVFFVLFLLISLAGLGGSDAQEGLYIFFLLLFIILVLVAWFTLPPSLRDQRIPENPKRFPAERPHHVRLFDDSTLYYDPKVPAPTAADLFFPAGRRPLFKLWWTGPGKLFVRSQETRLEFSFSGKGDPTQTVEAPITPTTVLEYIDFLRRTVVGPGGEKDLLRAKLAFETDLSYELPTGAVFSAGAEDDEDGDLPDKVVEYTELGTSADDTKVLVRHADKPLQAMRYGRNGPVESVNLEDDAIKGPGKVTSKGTVVTGEGTSFRSFFQPGDQIRTVGQVRVVTLVRSNTELVIATEFSRDAKDSDYDRQGPGLEPDDGYTYVSNPTAGVTGGHTLMDYAADVAAILCLGMTPHLLPTSELRVKDLDGKTAKQDGSVVDPAVYKVYQVFRNWSLDRRRLNEWRMLIAGGARSEKGSDPASYDAAMPQPPDPNWHKGDAGWAALARQGEPLANSLGWVPLLRKWLERAGDVKGNLSSPTPLPTGAPTNLDLSRALAFLFDFPNPVELA